MMGIHHTTGIVFRLTVGMFAISCFVIATILFPNPTTIDAWTVTTIPHAVAVLNNRRYRWTRRFDSVTTGTDASATATTTTGIDEIIGTGRIGSLLAQGGNCQVLRRNDTIDPNNNVGHPIYIATRNDALTSIVEQCPMSRREDLVFIQNGYLDDFFTAHGLSLEETTQVLLYLSVPSLGAPPMDGITSYNPEGLTMATGKHATTVAQRLARLDMKCHVVTDPSSFRPAMIEKLIWICTYMLVGTAKECESVGQAGRDYPELVAQLIAELLNAVQQQEPTIVFEPGTMERLAAYTTVVQGFPCGVKEFQWRNQYFYNLGSVTCPIHSALLEECQTKGYLSFDLPLQSK